MAKVINVEKNKMGQFTDRGQIPCGMTCKNPKACKEAKKCANEKD